MHSFIALFSWFWMEYDQFLQVLTILTFQWWAVTWNYEPNTHFLRCIFFIQIRNQINIFVLSCFCWGYLIIKAMENKTKTSHDEIDLALHIPFTVVTFAQIWILIVLLYIIQLRIKIKTPNLAHGHQCMAWYLGTMASTLGILWICHLPTLKATFLCLVSYICLIHLHLAPLLPSDVLSQTIHWHQLFPRYSVIFLCVALIVSIVVCIWLIN